MISTTFLKPKARRTRPVKQLKKVSRKGDFWLFVSKILNKFFLRIEMPQRCEACDGSAYCGQLTPAHTRRRQDIRVNDWDYALRVAVLGVHCHFDIDAKGRREAEPIVEKIITDRFKKMGLTPARVRSLLLQCALEVQAENPGKGEEPGKYDQYLVILDGQIEP